MNLNKICVPTACWAIAFLLTTLHAQQTRDPAESLFQRLNTHGDDLLSKDPKSANKSFARLDQNGEGQVSKAGFLSSKTEETAQEQGGATGSASPAEAQASSRAQIRRAAFMALSSRRPRRDP